jgi:hypothetical protein
MSKTAELLIGAALGLATLMFIAAIIAGAI